MELLHVGLQLGQGLQPGLDPLYVDVALLLPVLQHPVGVELAGVVHLQDEGGGGGRDGDPAQGRDGLRQGGQVVEILTSEMKIGEKYLLEKEESMEGIKDRKGRRGREGLMVTGSLLH